MDRRTSFGIVVACGVLFLRSASVADDVVHRARWAEIDLGGTLPVDLVDPEGRTRWDLRGVTLGAHWDRTVAAEGPNRTPTRWIEHRPQRGLGSAVAWQVRDLTGSGAGERWLLPERDPDLWRPGLSRATEIETDGPSGRVRSWIRSERVGLGWLFLPAGPREVVLQRAVVLRRDTAGQLQPEELIHRWVDPKAGLVAEVRGPVTPDGRARTRIDSAAVVEQIPTAALDLKLYTESIDRPQRHDIRFGWDRGAGTTVASLLPSAPATMADLIAAGTWDFSANTPANHPGMEQVASIITEVSATQASAFGQCGIAAGPGRSLTREDRVDAAGVLDTTINAVERQGGVTSPGLVLLLAAHRHEEQGGVGVEGEARLCHDPSSGRTAVPLWSFTHQDAGGWFADLGDSWQSDPPFNCQQIIWTNAIISQQLWAKAAASSNIGPLAGRQQSQVIAEGPVTLPSGHTFNALVLRTWVEYNLFPSSGCVFSFQAVRTVNHLWEVPFLGTVARLQSANNVNSLAGYSTVEETDIKFGLFPPRSITVRGTTASSVEIAWDPGLITDEIDRYKVYWDSDSGALSPYTFNSDSHPGQVVFNGTSAVISGLTPGAPYWFTVTSVRDYCEPGLCANNDCAPACPEPDPSPCPGVSCSVITPIESLVFPTQVAGGSTPIPAEVGATPGGACVPTQEISGVTVDKAGASTRICWAPSVDPCVEGYQILGAGSPTAAANFSAIVADTGLTNCWTFAPAEGYFLVVGASPAGTGPWGHYGR